MKEAFFGKKDEVSLARSLRLAVIQNQYAQGRLTETEAKEVLSGPLTPDDPTTVYDDSNCLVILEDFFEAVRNSLDITPEQKAYWMAIQERSAAQQSVQPADTAAAAGGDSDQSSSRANVGD